MTDPTIGELLFWGTKETRYGVLCVTHVDDRWFEYYSVSIQTKGGDIGVGRLTFADYRASIDTGWWWHP